MSQNLSAVCRQFGVSAIAENILPFGGGHINDTYCVNAAYEAMSIEFDATIML